jgi:hypothetical protein
VGLPREGFPGLEATEAFYARNGFTPLGKRMRVVLPVSSAQATREEGDHR